MGKQATFYHVSDTPVGVLFRGDGNRIQKDQLAVTYSLESYRRPDTADSSERIVERWHSTEMDIVGKFADNNQGSVAVGQGYLLLTERFLRGTVTGSGSKNRILVPDKNSYRLKAFSGTYAFLFDLVADVTEFNGHSKAVGISGQDSGLLVADPYTADEKWKSKMFALPGRRTIEFGEILLDTIIRAKMLYGDEQTSRTARSVADSDWRNKIASSGRTPYTVKFLQPTSLTNPAAVSTASGALCAMMIARSRGPTPVVETRAPLDLSARLWPMHWPPAHITASPGRPGLLAAAVCVSFSRMPQRRERCLVSSGNGLICTAFVDADRGA